MGKNETPEQPLLTFLATSNEVIALGAAVTTYQRQAARFPGPGKARQKTARLLERFQRRLVQQIDQKPSDPIEVELQKFLAKKKLL